MRKENENAGTGHMRELKSSRRVSRHIFVQAFHVMVLLAVFSFFSACANPTNSGGGGDGGEDISGLSATAGDALLILKWTNPTSTFDDVRLWYDSNVDGVVSGNAVSVGADATTYNLDGLTNDTTYEIRVGTVTEGKLSRGAVVTATPTEGGARSLRVNKYALSTSHPAYINAFFQVETTGGVPVTDLTSSDFVVSESGVQVTTTEAAVRIRKSDELPYTLRTVIMLDNSVSIGKNLTQVREAAKALVAQADSANPARRDGDTGDQLFAVWSFAANVVKQIEFTSDVAALNSAIDGISLGQGSTNLYEAVETGVEEWNNSYSASSIEEGIMVVLTDGDDTGGSSTLEQALSARGSKRVITVSVNPVEPEVLQELGNLGNLSIDSFDSLSQIFVEIQTTLEAFVNSFYSLNYLTPRAGSSSARVTIEVTKNINSESGSLTGSVVTDQLIAPSAQIYVDDDPSIPDGREPVYIVDGGNREVPVNIYFGEFGGVPAKSSLSVFSSPSGALSFSFTPYSDLPDTDRRRSSPQFGGVLSIRDTSVSPGDEVEVTVTDTENGHTGTFTVYVANAGFDFTDATGWSLGPNWSITDGRLNWALGTGQSTAPAVSPSISIPDTGGPYKLVVEDWKTRGAWEMESITVGLQGNSPVINYGIAEYTDEWRAGEQDTAARAGSLSRYGGSSGSLEFTLDSSDISRQEWSVTGAYVVPE